VRRTVPPSAEIEEQIDRLLAVGVGENPRESLSKLAKLGASLIIQRAVEDEFDAWLGRARYERRPDYERGLRNYEGALHNGFRPRKVQNGEGELSVEIPQVREAAEPFVSTLFPRGTKLLRTEPLRAMVIGAFVRGLSMRDVESLCEKAGLGSCPSRPHRGSAPSCATALSSSDAATSTTSSWRRCSSTRDFLSVRPDGPKEGVLVAWGFTEQGERVLLAVMLGMRESHEDWLEPGSDLIARGLAAPMLIVADGAPGLINAAEQCWPASDRQHCAVHRVRNLLAKLPERERVRQAYCKHSTRPSPNATPSSDSRRSSTSSTRPATPPRRSVSPTISTRSWSTCATQPGTAAGGGAPTCSKGRPDRLRHAGLRLHELRGPTMARSSTPTRLPGAASSS
jgi:putative transposase